MEHALRDLLSDADAFVLQDDAQLWQISLASGQTTPLLALWERCCSAEAEVASLRAALEPIRRYSTMKCETRSTMTPASSPYK